MIDNEFLLEDRLQKIRQVISKYGEENFFISFSGGRDSKVLSDLVDLAIPNNKIPRVFANTGIELNIVRDFVFKMAEHDDRVVIIQPAVPIKPMLEEEGYPFKSKEHSAVVHSYQNGNKDGKWVKGYLEKTGRYKCPEKLMYQFTDECKLNISDLCCDRLKKDPLHEWQKDNNKPYTMIGLMREEGGRRNRALCLAFQRDKLKSFQPLVAVTSEWRDWFIDQYKVEICDIYKPPYNFNRTGCKGCPFNPRLQKDLNILGKYFPNERKQCESIWKPVYDEYRRLGYRLKTDDGQIDGQMTLDFIKEV